MEANLKLQKLYEDSQSDWEYLALEEERRDAEKRFCSLMDSLPPPARECITEYLGILQEQELRLLELLCFQ